MTVPTLTLADFLLARIAEDEAKAQAAMHPSTRALWLDAPAGDSPAWSHVARWNGLRVLAECEAKRRIVERYVKIQGSRQDGDLVERQTLRWVMELHAVAHADHEDYRDEWRP